MQIVGVKDSKPVTIVSSLPHLLPSDMLSMKRKEKGNPEGLLIRVPLSLGCYNLYMGSIVSFHFISSEPKTDDLCC